MVGQNSSDHFCLPLPSSLNTHPLIKIGQQLEQAIEQGYTLLMKTISLFPTSQTLAYSEYQPEKSPCLCLIHGAGGDHLDWPGELLRPDHLATAAVDLPGHGRSPAPGLTLVDDYAAVVSALIGTLDRSDIVLVGHSMGGAIAQQIAADTPAWLIGLVLIGTAPRMPVSPQILNGIHEDFGRAADFLNKYGWSKSAPPLKKGMGRKKLLNNDPDTLYGDFSACNGFDGRDLLPNIRVPTLIVGGTADKMIPFTQSQAMTAEIPKATCVAIDGAGHYLMQEKPRAVASHVIDFSLTLLS